jgi:hypothetical protein
MNEIYDHEIEGCDEAAEQQHGHDHDHCGISQLFVAPDALVLRFPRPRRFSQLGANFAEKIFRFRDHWVALNRLSDEALKRAGGFHDITLQLFNPLTFFNKPGQEGLEPPTDGFGDRYSTN